jgi:predicted ATP-dependent endonuclease of OLD family
MMNSVTFNNFRSFDELTVPLSQITMLTGPNCIGKTTVLEGIYCLFSETRSDASVLPRYQATPHLSGTPPSICKYLDFPFVRQMPPSNLSYTASQFLVKALKIINSRITDVRDPGDRTELSVILDDKYSAALGTLGSGVDAWTRTLIALSGIIETKLPTDTSVIILIDEIGACIHYSVMLSIWEYIRDFVEKYPFIQFVTTCHSNDCVRAFCEAFSGSDEATVVRLHKTAIKSKIIPTTYSRKQFPKIISGDWEVRG